MSKRLQVLLLDEEYREIEEIARRKRLTVSEWVRLALRFARRQEAAGEPEKKLAVIRAASRFEFPTADVETMLSEIESGYSTGA